MNLGTNLVRSSVWAGSVLAVGVFFGGAHRAEALLIDPATTTAVATGNQTGQAQIDPIIDDYIGVPLANYQLYKSNVGDGEAGPLAGSYETTFDNTPDDPADALIEYVGGDYVGPIAWLLVKGGGAAPPAWYLYNLTDLGWNGTDDLSLVNFWPGRNAISHVTLYGSRTAVPEPATLSLLGAGLAGLLLVRRRKQAPSA